MSRDSTDPQTERDPDAREADRSTVRERGANKWLSGIASLIGLWVAISPFVYDVTEMATWNNLVVGAAILLLAGYNVYRMNEGHEINAAAAGLVVLLGLWLIVAPFLIEIGNEGFGWSTLVSGALAAVLSGYNAYKGTTTETRTTTRART